MKEHGHNYTRFHQDHDLERLVNEEKSKQYGFDVKYWHCKKCLISWNTRPRLYTCLGMPRYNVRRYRPSHLFTRKELARKHLTPGSKPEGYVYVPNRPYWVFLYDIAQAKPTKE